MEMNKKNKIILSVFVIILIAFVVFIIMRKDASTPVVDVCFNIEGIQVEMPEGMEIVDGQCIKILVDPIPTPIPTPTPTPDPEPELLEQLWLDGSVTKINLAEDYLIIQPLWPQDAEEVKIIINPETKIEKEEILQEKIDDLVVGDFIGFETKEDIRARAEVIAINNLWVIPSELATIAENPAYLNFEQLWLNGSVTKINLAEDYLIIQPTWMNAKEIKVILSPEIKVERVKKINLTINDIQVGNYIGIQVKKDIRGKTIIDNIKNINVFIIP